MRPTEVIIDKSCTPHVTVIIPCFNHGHYLGHALQSVLAQTHAEWEAIIVDDGSTDNTREVAAQFTDPRVRYLYQENRGLSAARNTGIQAARGDYLCFLDADDEWYPDFLSTCVGALSKNREPHIVGVYTSNVHIDEVGRLLPQPGCNVVPPHELPNKMVASNFFPPCAVMIEADVVREMGMFDESLSSTEDKDLWLRVTRSYTMLGIPQPLARYRVYPGSMSTNAATMHLNRMAVLGKHFGPDEGDPAQWSPDKRLAYSHGYRGSALAYMTQGETEMGWSLLIRGACIAPELLTQQGTYYRMACVGQPRGYRGHAASLDVQKVGSEILDTLEAHLSAQGQPLIALRKPAIGSACLAFAALADQAGNWRLARQYMWRAFRAYPRLFLSTNTARRTVKLLAGKRLSFMLQSLYRSRVREVRHVN